MSLFYPTVSGFFEAEGDFEENREDEPTTIKAHRVRPGDRVTYAGETFTASTVNRVGDLIFVTTPDTVSPQVMWERRDVTVTREDRHAH
jgi:hypothetical protein